MKLYVVDREAGNIIEEVGSVAEGKRLIAKFEKADLEEFGEEPDNFYDVVNEDRESVL